MLMRHFSYGYKYKYGRLMEIIRTFDSTGNGHSKAGLQMCLTSNGRSIEKVAIASKKTVEEPLR